MMGMRRDAYGSVRRSPTEARHTYIALAVKGADNDGPHGLELDLV